VGEIHRRVHVEAGHEVGVALGQDQRVAQVFRRRPVRPFDDQGTGGIDLADRGDHAREDRIPDLGREVVGRLVEDLEDDRGRQAAVARGDLLPHRDQTVGVGARGLHHLLKVMQIDDHTQVIGERLIDHPVDAPQKPTLDAKGWAGVDVRRKAHGDADVIEPGLVHGAKIGRRQHEAPISLVGGIHGVAEVHPAAQLTGGAGRRGARAKSVDARFGIGARGGKKTEPESDQDRGRGNKPRARVPSRVGATARTFGLGALALLRSRHFSCLPAAREHHDVGSQQGIAFDPSWLLLPFSVPSDPSFLLVGERNRLT
jgi:hypothetical protein